MSKLSRRLGAVRLPIRWKLTAGSALMLIIIFACYHIVLYMAIEQSMSSRHERSMRATMATVLNHILEREIGFMEAELAGLGQALGHMNERDQLIRIVSQEGMAVALVTHGVPEEAGAGAVTSETDLSIHTEDGSRYMVLAAPIVIHAFQGTVEIVRVTDESMLLIRSVGQVMLYTGIGAVLLSALGGAWLSGLLLRPLRAMATTIRKVRQEGWQERMPVTGSRDEMDTLMLMFNEMMDDVGRSFDRQRQFTQDASHELRTPIAIVEGHLSMLRRWGASDPEVLQESLKASGEEIARLRRLVEELLTLTRIEELPPERGHGLEDAGAALESILHKVRDVYLSHPLELTAAGLNGLSLTITGEHLEQLLIILLDNAANYSPAGNPIRITCSGEAWGMQLEVADQGIGISEADLPFIFDRFYRADKARSGDMRGTGLGLSIAKRLTEQAGGSIIARSEESKGTSVIVKLPRQQITDGSMDRGKKA
ncbi:ATP-binding protein [Paenibacillus sp. 1P07SE]|uniref:sensor histidine kinase n=1 Tax=Paenibacillus sp. 1P07SE TaxID=3132209 RepID=UPI0039A70437